MKIAQVLVSPRIGGAETLVASLATEWAEQNVQSTVIYLDPANRKRSRLRAGTLTPPSSAGGGA